MPGTTPGLFTEIWAIVSDEGDREAMVALHVPSIGWIPLKPGDQSIVDRFLDEARAIADETGKRLKIVSFRRGHEQPLPPELARDDQGEPVIGCGKMVGGCGRH